MAFIQQYWPTFVNLSIQFPIALQFPFIKNIHGLNSIVCDLSRSCQIYLKRIGKAFTDTLKGVVQANIDL